LCDLIYLTLLLLEDFRRVMHKVQHLNFDQIAFFVGGLQVCEKLVDLFSTLRFFS